MCSDLQQRPTIKPTIPEMLSHKIFYSHNKWEFISLILSIDSWKTRPLIYSLKFIVSSRHVSLNLTAPFLVASHSFVTSKYFYELLECETISIYLQITQEYFLWLKILKKKNSPYILVSIKLDFFFQVFIKLSEEGKQLLPLPAFWITEWNFTLYFTIYQTFLVECNFFFKELYSF